MGPLHSAKLLPYPQEYLNHQESTSRGVVEYPVYSGTAVYQSLAILWV